MTRRRPLRVVALPASVALATVLAACGTSTPTGTTAVSPRPTPTGAAVTPTRSPDQATTLPGGLERRPGLPPLVDGEAASCVPGCGAGRVAGGAIPAGRYQTRWFFGGYMSIETDGTWTLGEDSNAELSLPVRGDYQMAFGLDPQLVLHGTIDDDVPLQASAYIAWLASHPDLVVSEPETTGIGSVRAIATDIRLAATAGQDETDCGSDPCITFIKSPVIEPPYDHVDGILGDDVYRFYFADISYSDTDHLFVLKVEARDRDDLRSSLERLEPVLESVTIPARPAGG